MSKIVDREGLKAFRERLDEKYVIEGEYSPQTSVGLADNFTPYSEDSGAEQSNPFISNGTGTNNNQEIVTVGDYGLLRSKNGNTVVVNQYMKEMNSSNWTVSSGTVSFSNGVATFTVTAANAILTHYGYLNLIVGHKYIMSCEMLTTANANQILLEIGYHSNYRFGNIQSSSWQKVGGIIEYGVAGATKSLMIRDTRSSDWDAIQVKNVQFIDLTQWFNGDIPQDILDNPDHFSWYYNGDLSYNIGTLVNANGVKLVSTGRNLWDEEWELGTFNNTTGEKANANNKIRSKNFIKVIPNTTYYGKGIGRNVYYYDANNNYLGYAWWNTDATITIPNNVYNIMFAEDSTYGATYNHDITISIYYTPEQGGEGYDKYYPYETPYEVNTGSEVLRSAGSVHDIKKPSGEITRNIGTYTFTGSENIQIIENSTYGNFIKVKGFPISFISPLKATDSLALIDKFGLLTGYNPFGSARTQICYFYTEGTTLTLIFRPDNMPANQTSAVSLLTGAIMNYAVETPTTEQGTPFAENLQINDYGMLYWDSDIPQGNTIFFPINYKGFLDDMYSRVDGDSSKYVIDTDLSEYVKQVDLSSQCVPNSNLEVSYLKLYKTGKVCVLSVRAKNISGSPLAINTVLITVPTSAGAIAWNAYPYYVDTLTTLGMLKFSSTNMTNNEEIPNNASFYINMAYISNL